MINHIILSDQLTLNLQIKIPRLISIENIYISFHNHSSFNLPFLKNHHKSNSLIQMKFQWDETKSTQPKRESSLT